jgi:hypothetical protein
MNADRDGLVTERLQRVDDVGDHWVDRLITGLIMKDGDLQRWKRHTNKVNQLGRRVTSRRVFASE